jgi:hypothetical protein
MKNPDLATVFDDSNGDFVGGSSERWRTEMMKHYAG